MGGIEFAIAIIAVLLLLILLSVPIVLALGATITGQTTANYIFQELDKYSIKITSLAQGVPVGGELDYLDDSTIVAAFNARRKFD